MKFAARGDRGRRDSLFFAASASLSSVEAPAPVFLVVPSAPPPAAALSQSSIPVSASRVILPPLGLNRVPLPHVGLPLAVIFFECTHFSPGSSGAGPRSPVEPSYLPTHRQVAVDDRLHNSSCDPSGVLRVAGQVPHKQRHRESHYIPDPAASAATDVASLLLLRRQPSKAPESEGDNRTPADRGRAAGRGITPPPAACSGPPGPGPLIPCGRGLTRCC